MIAAAASLLLAVGAGEVRPKLPRRPPPAAHALWSSPRGSIWIVPCMGMDDGGGDCAGLELRTHAARRLLGQGYLDVSEAHKLLWRRRAGERGPDVVVLGSAGGSGGCVDVFALTLASRPAVQKLAPCRDDLITVFSRDGVAATDVVFAVRDVRGASNAATTTVLLPLRWNGHRFALDRKALAERARDADDDALRFVTIENSLGLADANPDDPDARVAWPAVTALAGLMTTGRADRARHILDQLWPRRLDAKTLDTSPAPAKDAFWRELCAAIVSNPMWREFGLDRLPHASLVREGARAR